MDSREATARGVQDTQETTAPWQTPGDSARESDLVPTAVIPAHLLSTRRDLRCAPHGSTSRLLIISVGLGLLVCETRARVPGPSRPSSSDTLELFDLDMK